MSTYTPSLGLEKITPGSQAGLWGNTTNNSLDLIDQAVTGVTELSFAAANGTTQILTDDNGAVNQARAAVLNITGVATGANTVVVPNKQKTYLVRNETGQTVRFQTATPVEYYDVEAGYSILIFCDGNNNVLTGIKSPSIGTLSVSNGGTGNTGFGTGGFIKSTGGTNSLTYASSVALASEVSGTLPVANGGTGAVSLISGGLLIGQGTGTVTSLIGAVNGYIPTWNSATNSWVAAAPTSSGVSSIAGGTGISVSGPSGAVIVSNSGVTGLTAGSGITLSGSTGNVQISASGTSPVTNVFGRTGAITAQSTDYSSFYYPLSSNPSGYVTSSSLSSYMPKSGGTFTGAVNFSATAQCNAWNMAATTSMYLLSGSQIVWAINNNTVQYVDFNGNIRIYGTSAGKSGGGLWYDSSDARLKENIQPLTGALEKLSALNPVTYEWKYDRQDVSNVGFIAQEVESIFPLVVSETEPTEAEKPFIPEGSKVKNIGWQNDMMAYLVSAIKELKIELDSANARIAALEAK